MLAGFQRTQHGFLQYVLPLDLGIMHRHRNPAAFRAHNESLPQRTQAQRLSDNSAKLWLSAETSARRLAELEYSV